MRHSSSLSLSLPSQYRSNSPLRASDVTSVHVYAFLPPSKRHRLANKYTHFQERGGEGKRCLQAFNVRSIQDTHIILVLQPAFVRFQNKHTWIKGLKMLGFTFAFLKLISNLIFFSPRHSLQLIFPVPHFRLPLFTCKESNAFHDRATCSALAGAYRSEIAKTFFLGLHKLWSN